MNHPINHLGKVWLVGAGPGDVSLITVKGMDCIQYADVIVYDRLINPALLDYAREGCETINVGKRCNAHLMPQEKINDILVKKAKLGQQVVRLKSGDPYVFGRGGEEVEALVAAGLAFEVVPGVSSAVGGLAYAGIPITHRDYASSFHVVTGHLKAGKDPLNWGALSELSGTLVILMGMANIDYIMDQLIRNKRNPDTPVAIIMWATHDQQRFVLGTLATISNIAKAQNVSAPGLIVIGEVVALHQTLNFSKFISDIKDHVKDHVKDHKEDV